MSFLWPKSLTHQFAGNTWYEGFGGFFTLNQKLGKSLRCKGKRTLTKKSKISVVSIGVHHTEILFDFTLNDIEILYQEVRRRAESSKSNGMPSRFTVHFNPELSFVIRSEKTS